MPAFPGTGWTEDPPEAFSVEQEQDPGLTGLQDADASPLTGEEEEPVKVGRGLQARAGGWRAGAARPLPPTHSHAVLLLSAVFHARCRRAGGDAHPAAATAGAQRFQAL
jgi:hypothetical protein